MSTTTQSEPPRRLTEQLSVSARVRARLMELAKERSVLRQLLRLAVRLEQTGGARNAD
jgi:hypothetical protein